MLNIGAGALWGVGAAFAILVGAIALSVLMSGFEDTDEQYITPGEAFALMATFCAVFGGICGCFLGGVQGLVYCVQSVPMTDDAATAKCDESSQSYTEVAQSDTAEKFN